MIPSQLYWVLIVDGEALCVSDKDKEKVLGKHFTNSIHPGLINITKIYSLVLLLSIVQHFIMQNSACAGELGYPIFT